MMPNFYSCATWGENGKRSEQNIAEGCDKATIENHMNTYVSRYSPLYPLADQTSHQVDHQIRLHRPSSSRSATSPFPSPIPQPLTPPSSGINTVRLPVGYWTLGRAHCACEEMPYWPYIDKYEKAWRVVMQAIEWAGEVGIGVLLVSWCR